MLVLGIDRFFFSSYVCYIYALLYLSLINIVDNGLWVWSTQSSAKEGIWVWSVQWVVVGLMNSTPRRAYGCGQHSPPPRRAYGCGCGVNELYAKEGIWVWSTQSSAKEGIWVWLWG